MSPAVPRLQHMRARVPWVLWALPLALVARHTLFVRSRGTANFAVVDTSGAVDILLVGAAAFMLICSARTKLVARAIAGTSAGAVFGFYFLCLASAVWSSLPAYCAYRAVQVLAEMGLAFLVVSHYGRFFRIERLVLFMAMLILCVDFCGRVKLAGWGGLHTNSYTAAASMILCYCFGEFAGAHRNRKRYLLACGVLSLVALFLGTCSSSNIGTICGIAAAGLLGRSKMRPLIIILIAGVVLMYAAGCQDAIEDATYTYLLPGKTPEKVTSMTGRAEMWEWAMGMVEAKPFLGHGFAVATRENLKANSAHNTVVAILLDTGIVGLLVFAVAAGRILKETASGAKLGRPGSVGSWCMFIAAIVNCMGVPFLGVDWRPSTQVFALFLALYSLHVLGRRRMLDPPRPFPVPRRRERVRSSDGEVTRV